MPGWHFFRDADGRPRADGGHRALCRFLESDVQESLEIALSVEALLGLPEPASFSGNSFTLILDNDRVSLEHLFDETLEAPTLSRGEFRRALRQWRHLIEGSSRAAGGCRGPGEPGGRTRE